MNKKKIGVLFSLVAGVAMIVGGGFALTSTATETYEPEAAEAAATDHWDLCASINGATWVDDILAVYEGNSYSLTLYEGDYFKWRANGAYSNGELNYSVLVGKGITYNNLTGSNFSSNSSGDCVINEGYGGVYTFRFVEGLIAYNDKSYGVTISYEAAATATASYSPVVNAGYPCQTATLSEQTGKKLSTITPEFYGYTFGGWYTDVSLTTGVSTDATVDQYADGGLYAKFTANESGNSTYKVDYSVELSTFSEAASLFVYYQNSSSGDDVPFPGINFGPGSENTGLITVSIPSDATLVILSAFNSDSTFTDDTKITQTTNVNVSTSNPSEIFLTGDRNSSSYNYYFAYQADAGYVTIRDALVGLINYCDEYYENNANTVVGEEISNAWKAIINAESSYKTYNNFSYMKADEYADASSIASALARYDFIATKYGSSLVNEKLGVTAYNPLGRSITPSHVYHFTLADDNSMAYIAIAAVSGVAVLAIAAYIVIKKKKEASVEE